MKRSELPSLDDLRAFETVARVGSVRGAADELALTHGAVSRRITKLARDLELELVKPLGRGIVLTESGLKLAESANRGFGIISATLNALKKTEGDPPIVLSCERSVALRWLIPRLSQFEDAHPDISVHLSVGGGHLELTDEVRTLGIRRLDFPMDPSWSVEPIFEEKMGPVMPPTLQKPFEHGTYTGLPTRTRPEAWNRWLAQNTQVNEPSDIRYFDHHFLMAEAAANGLGVALCPQVIALDDLENGRLIAPHGFDKDGSDYGLIYLADAKKSAQFSQLMSWVRDVASSL